MAIRQEQVVFLVAVGVLGLLMYGGSGDGASEGANRRRSRSTRPASQVIDAEHYPTPDLSRVIAIDREPSDLDRFLFEPPRDTRPLPLLTFDMPPRPELPELAPPTAPGPAARLFGQLLRLPVNRSESVAGLFNETGAAGTAFGEFDALEDPFAEPEPSSGDDGGDLPLNVDLFTADEIAERIASYQKLSDSHLITLNSLQNMRNGRGSAAAKALRHTPFNAVHLVLFRHACELPSHFYNLIDTGRAARISARL